MTPSKTNKINKGDFAPPVAVCADETGLMKMLNVIRRCALDGFYSCRTCQKFQFQPNRFYTSKNILKLEERGLWADRFPESNTNKLIEELLDHQHTVYSGFDPTADSLHVGNLLVVVSLLHCQRAGHNVIALVGGATAQVGDPSGRSKERPLLQPKVIEGNSKGIAENLQRIFKNHQQVFWERGNEENLAPLRIVNNYDWYKKLNVVDFLRVAGRSFRMGTMLSRSSVQSRLNSEDGMSLTEFTYQALQAYDWLHLYDKYNCTIQIGGNDQMGNIASGHELISRLRDKQVTGLTVPIITTEAGNKFGKSAGNAIWLDRNKTSAFDFYQFFFRVKDSEVEKFLMLFTFLHVKDINKIMAKHWEKPEAHHAQKKLAEKVTLLVHGYEGLESARRTTEALYGGRPDALAQMTSEELAVVFQSAASAKLVLEPGTSVLKMAMDAGCYKEEKDARRIISAGGFYVNLSRVTNPDLILIPGVHILPNGITIARVGKKNYYLIKWN
ncbi:tyrosine--tRNA ligase, mitochondrial-like [Penaeus chinensis]|uniref:tyrosine--tRNA ligase, mitochondrial-like n=1 Tax=Penaeus chinensis TaxID=139456 RepID=UPI001FB6D9EB|nr:tyrosine--tRNA ligase, mitochondrial-like [Penaeus chinensis]